MKDKILLAHMDTRTRLYNFTLDSGSIYKKSVSYFISKVIQNGTELTLASSSSVGVSEYYFDIDTNYLYIYSSDINNDIFVVDYRFFFSNAPLNFAYDLSNDLSEQVNYEPRILKTSGFKSQINSDMIGIALIGNGSLSLENSDEYFKTIFDKFIWENKPVSIYTYERNDNPTDAQLIYKGYITSKAYSTKEVSFGLKDGIKILNEPVELERYTSSDNVNDDVINIYKNRIFGKASGLKLQSIDQVGESHELTGTLTGNTSYSGQTFTAATSDVITCSSHGYIEGELVELTTSNTLPAGLSEQEYFIKYLDANTFKLGESLKGAAVDITDTGTGTHTITKSSKNISGSSTLFMAELSPSDTLNYLNKEYNIEHVVSNTLLILSEELENSFVGETIEASYSIPSNLKNRKWLLSNKVLSEANTTVVKALSSYWVELSSVSDLAVGDWLEFTTATKKIEHISENNLIKVTTAFDTVPAQSSAVSRPPVQEVYYKGKLVNADLYTITNNSTDGCYIEFETDFEEDFTNRLNVYSRKAYNGSNGSNIIEDSVSESEYDLTKKVEVRDYIKINDSAWIEVLEVEKNRIFLRENLISDYTSQYLYVKKAKEVLLDDDSVVGCVCYGEAEDDTTSGTLIKTASQVIYKILDEKNAGLDIDSFKEAEEDAPQLISLVVGGEDEAPNLKELVDKINKTVFGALILDLDFNFKYKILNFEVDYDNLQIISKYDCIKEPSFKTISGSLYATVNGNYKYEEVNYLSESESNELYSFDSDFVSTYVETGEELELEMHLYNEADAQELVQRKSLLSNQFTTEVKIQIPVGKFESLEIGQTVMLDMDLFDAFGGNSSYRLGIISGIDKKDDLVEFTVLDMGIFSRRSVITPDDAPDYDSCTDLEKVIYSFITDDNGLIDSDEDTFEQNILI